MKFITRAMMYDCMLDLGCNMYETQQELKDNADHIFGCAGDSFRDEYGDIHYDFEIGDKFLNQWCDWMKNEF